MNDGEAGRVDPSALNLRRGQMETRNLVGHGGVLAVRRVDPGQHILTYEEAGGVEGEQVPGVPDLWLNIAGIRDGRGRLTLR